MLDAFKKSDAATRQQSEELQALIAASREERAALSTMLTQVQLHSARVVSTARTLQEVEEQAGKAHARLEDMSGRLQALEAQTATLTEGARQASRTEDLIDRVEKLAREVGGQLDTGLKARDALAADLVKLEADRGALTGFVRNYTDTLALERREFEAFDQRLKALRTAVTGAEASMEGLSTRDRLAAAIQQKVDQLSKEMQTLGASADDLTRKHAALDGLRESLGQVDELTGRTARQYDALKEHWQDLDSLRKELHDVYAAHAEAAQLCDRLAADRLSMEAFLDRTAAFRNELPELDARITAITGRLAIVDEGTQQAANLVTLADDLDRQMNRVTGQQQFVERLEARLNNLHVLADDTDRKLGEQVARRGEVEALRNQIDGVAIAVTDVRQKLEAIAALQGKLTPLATQISMLKSAVEKVHHGVVAAQQDETVLAEQEQRLAGMLAATRDVAREAEERLNQVQGLAGELRRSAAVKDEVLQELARVQAHQRDVTAQLAASGDQLARLETAARGLEKGRSDLAFTEKRIAAFEARASEVEQMTVELDAKIAGITHRDGAVEAVRNELAAVHEVSARSREVLDDVMQSVSQLTERVQEAQSSLRSLQGERT